MKWLNMQIRIHRLKNFNNTISLIKTTVTIYYTYKHIQTYFYEVSNIMCLGGILDTIYDQDSFFSLNWDRIYSKKTTFIMYFWLYQPENWSELNNVIKWS